MSATMDRERTQVPADAAAQPVVVYGRSDDLVEVEGRVRGCGEYLSDDACFLLYGEGAVLWLRCWYMSRGIWAIALAPAEEGVPMLAAKLTGDEYSARAVIEGVKMVVP